MANKTTHKREFIKAACLFLILLICGTAWSLAARAVGIPSPFRLLVGVVIGAFITMGLLVLFWDR